MPQPSETNGETVCVAGVTREQEWRRLYPIRFRQLDEGFKRWQWVDCGWRKPRRDKRAESRHVEEASIKPAGTLKKIERARFLEPLVRPSVDLAAKRGESLCVIRPQQTQFYFKPKTNHEVAAERAVYARAASQLSLLDKELEALTPCPYRFYFRYRTADGKYHENVCHDWETSAAFFLLSQRYNETRALAHLMSEYNERYPEAGMAFAMGTHSRHPETWLLIGVLRLDDPKQAELVL